MPPVSILGKCGGAIGCTGYCYFSTLFYFVISLCFFTLSLESYKFIILGNLNVISNLVEQKFSFVFLSIDGAVGAHSELKPERAAPASQHFKTLIIT